MLLLSAFFSGMEIAFLNKNRLKLEIDRKQSRMFNYIADLFSRNQGQYITTILVGNNITLVIYSMCMSQLIRGIAYLLGGEYINMEYAVNNMIADISGLICDGAKAGCALKIATSVAGAIQRAYLAVEGSQVPGRDGIVCADVEESIHNLGNLGNKGMCVTDKVILDMMLENKPGA